MFLPTKLLPSDRTNLIENLRHETADQHSHHQVFFRRQTAGMSTLITPLCSNVDVFKTYSRHRDRLVGMDTVGYSAPYACAVGYMNWMNWTTWNLGTCLVTLYSGPPGPLRGRPGSIQFHVRPVAGSQPKAFQRASTRCTAGGVRRRQGTTGSRGFRPLSPMR